MTIPSYKVVAIGLFRSSVFFIFAVAAFAERDRHTSIILASVVFLLDVVSWHVCQVILWNSDTFYCKIWYNTLVDRFALKRFAEDTRFRQAIDFDGLINAGRVDAQEDIQRHISETLIGSNWGRFRKTLAGIGHFLWNWISYGIFYGIAGAVGQSMR